MRTTFATVWAPLLVLASAGTISVPFAASAQTATPQSIEQRLDAVFVPAKATADGRDIVTAGAVLVLKKDGLLMSWTNGAPAANTFKDGKISHGAWGLVARPGFRRMMSPDQAAQSRLFVTGEKFWVTNISVHDDSIVFDLLSDPIGDYRYHATLKFPFQKNVYPSEDQAMAMVSELLDVVQPDNGPPQQTAAAPEAPPPPAEQAPPPDQAPPAEAPPADAPPATPKTITLNETKAQVIADFGQPTRIAKLAAGKEIDYYPDMKVTFVNGKVTAVE